MKVSKNLLAPEKTAPRTTYKLREKVHINYKGQRLTGQVRILQKDFKYTIELSDGTVIPSVPGTLLRPVIEYFKNEKVEGSECFWFKGIVQKVNPDGTINLLYNDGFKTNLIFDRVRKQLKRYPPSAKVEVNSACISSGKLMSGKGSWVRGFILQRNDENNTCVSFLILNSFFSIFLLSDTVGLSTNVNGKTMFTGVKLACIREQASDLTT